MNSITPRAASTAVISAIQINSFQELMRFAEMAAPSDLMPTGYKGKPGNIVIAVQMGSELGLSPMQALSNIAVINGRASVWGDALLGLVRNSPKCQDVHEVVAGEGDARNATCTIKRLGSSDTVRTFSVNDAKNAGLWDKAGPWKQYPDRMLQMRARGFACRDAFPDVLRGLISAEEATDMPVDSFAGTTIVAEPEPAPPQSAPAPVNYVALFQSRLAKCSDADCVLKQGEMWKRAVASAAEAGRPISKDVQSQVIDLIADAYGRFQVMPENTDADDMGGMPD